MCTTFDGFLGKETSVMVATDVAARGLGELWDCVIVVPYYNVWDYLWPGEKIHLQRDRCHGSYGCGC